MLVIYIELHYIIYIKFNKKRESITPRVPKLYGDTTRCFTRAIMKYFNLDKVVLNYAYADWNLISSYLTCIKWTVIFCNSSCDNVWFIFWNIFHNVVNLFVPLVNLCKRREVPWINSFIMRLEETRLNIMDILNRLKDN